MAAGPKHSRLTIQQDRPTRGSDGGAIENWVTLATVWAEGGPLTGNLAWKAKQAQSEITHQFKIRYGAVLSDLSGSVRLILKGRVLSLQDARNVDEKNKEWELDAIEAPDSSLDAFALLDPQGDVIRDPDYQVIQEP